MGDEDDEEEALQVADAEVDITAFDAVEVLRSELDRWGAVFALACVKQGLRNVLDVCALTASVGADRICPTLRRAVAACRA